MPLENGNVAEGGLQKILCPSLDLSLQEGLPRVTAYDLGQDKAGQAPASFQMVHTGGMDCTGRLMFTLLRESLPQGGGQSTRKEPARGEQAGMLPPQSQTLHSHNRMWEAEEPPNPLWRGV